MSTFKRAAAAVFATGLAFSTPMATAQTAQAQSVEPPAGTPAPSLDPGPPDMTRLPAWAFEALHYGPMNQAQVDACWNEMGDVIILIYPGPCPDGPVSHLEYRAAQILWFFTSHSGG